MVLGIGNVWDHTFGRNREEVGMGQGEVELGCNLNKVTAHFMGTLEMGQPFRLVQECPNI